MSNTKKAFNKENVPELLGQLKRLLNKYEMESIDAFNKAESAISKEWNSPEAKEKRSDIGKKKKRNRRASILRVAQRHLRKFQ